MTTPNRRTLTRRGVLRGAAAVSAGAAAASAGVALTGGEGRASAAGLAGFPSFSFHGEAFDIDALRYNPTGELIFPCIRWVGDRVANPLGNWYLYYSPHDAPGGICLAYGDTLGGPFTEYEDNPIISKDWAPHYNVSHVASPHALWNASNATMYLYFHGENDTTRFARSTDGVNFTYDSVAVTTDMLPADVTETSYARVFRHTIPGKDNTYLMTFMGSQAGTRRIFLAWSDTQRDWQVQQEPLINPEPDGETQIANAHLWRRDGGTYVVYNGSSGRMYVTDVGERFDREDHLGAFHTPMSGPPDNGRSAAPSFAEEDGSMFMFYESGQRLHATIAVATAPL